MDHLPPFTLLNTRPLHQAQKLSAVVDNLGGEVILFPTLEIAPINFNRQQISSFQQQLTVAKILIVTSANAVYFAPKVLLQQIQAQQAGLIILSMGASTSAALAENNITANHSLFAGGTSEDLLELDVLAKQNIINSPIVLLTGKAGRELLQDNLLQKKADLTSIEVYLRSCPKLAANFDFKVITTAKRLIITATSISSLENLLTLMPSSWHQQLFKKPLLVVSSRLKEFAESKGFSRVLLSPNLNGSEFTGLLRQVLKDYDKII